MSRANCAAWHRGIDIVRIAPRVLRGVAGSVGAAIRGELFRPSHWTGEATNFMHGFGRW
jgi:hypothetical protein